MRNPHQQRAERSVARRALRPHRDECFLTNRGMAPREPLSGFPVVSMIKLGDPENALLISIDGMLKIRPAQGH